MRNPATLAIMFGLIAAVAWGVSDFFTAKAAKRFSSWPVAFFTNIINATLYVTVYAIWLHPAAQTFTAEGVAYGLASGVALALAGIVFTKSVELGPVSVVSPIAGTYPFITALIAVAAFGALISASQIVGIALIVLGVTAASGLADSKGKRIIGRGPLFGIGAALFWGIGFALLAQATQRLGWETSTFLESLALGGTFLVLFFFTQHRKPIELNQVKAIIKTKFVWGAGILSIVGTVALNIGLSLDIAASPVTTAVSACFPVLTVMLALHGFKEKIEMIALAGALTSVAGVVVLSLG